MGGSEIDSINSVGSTQKDIDWTQYYNCVYADFRELKGRYPFCHLIIPPTIEPSPAEIRVVAACKELVNAVGGVESDFLNKYSKELHLCIPIDYQNRGCIVYGANWIETEKLENNDIHFFHNNGELIRTKYGLQICVGIPDSFPMMKNVILENVRTAENMLIAYERLLTGQSDKLELIAYMHGERGRMQFQQNEKRYTTKR